jgi:hypothetical protein
MWVSTVHGIDSLVRRERRAELHRARDRCKTDLGRHRFAADGRWAALVETIRATTRLDVGGWSFWNLESLGDLAETSSLREGRMERGSRMIVGSRLVASFKTSRGVAAVRRRDGFLLGWGFDRQGNFWRRSHLVFARFDLQIRGGGMDSGSGFTHAHWSLVLQQSNGNQPGPGQRIGR